MIYKGLKAFLHFLEYVGLKIIYYACLLIPFEICIKLVDISSPILYLLFPIRKRVILQNLERAFPGQSKQSLNMITKKIYKHFLVFLIEFIHLGKRSTIDFSRQIIEIEGEEYIKEARLGKNSFLIVTGHLGNWELMGAYFASQGIKFSVLAKPIHNPYINDFVNRIREEKGIKVISTKDISLKPIFKDIKERRGLVFLADQDARHSGIFIDFFGTPASTFTGPALLSIRTGLPLIPLFNIRKDLITHKIIIHPPIYPPVEKDREKAIEDIMQKYTRILEDMIRKYPDQYFWFHRRWKTKPKKKIGRCKSIQT